MSPDVVFTTCTRTPFVWDERLLPNTLQRDQDGLWHVGLESDILNIEFEMALTKRDRQFLKDLRITTG